MLTLQCSCIVYMDSLITGEERREPDGFMCYPISTHVDPPSIHQLELAIHRVRLYTYARMGNIC